MVSIWDCDRCSSLQLTCCSDSPQLVEAATGAEYEGELQLATKLKTALNPLTLYAQELERVVRATSSYRQAQETKPLADTINDGSLKTRYEFELASAAVVFEWKENPTRKLRIST